MRRLPAATDKAVEPARRASARNGMQALPDGADPAHDWQKECHARLPALACAVFAGYPVLFPGSRWRMPVRS